MDSCASPSAKSIDIKKKYFGKSTISIKSHFVMDDLVKISIVIFMEMKIIEAEIQPVKRQYYSKYPVDIGKYLNENSNEIHLKMI